MSTLSHSFFTFSIVPKMGFVYLIFALMSFLFEPLSCQEQQQQQQPQPNTDGYFVSEFFKRMNSTTSPSKISQTHNLSLPVCSWQGVFCDPNREHVIELVASNLGLSGPIPDTTIGKLTKLQALDLSSNNITALPADFWSLGSLKSLNLSSNAISGPLPNDVGNFALLESLDVSGNRFSGPIPQTVGSIYGLRAIRLDRNGFDQTVPSGLIRCQSLVSIDLSLNRLSGPLPEGFGAAFPKLRALSLAGNGISGRDSDFSGMNSIATLNVSGNLFEGSAAGMLKEALEVVDLSKNRFRGRVSEVRFEDWPHLVYLDLSENELSGEISFHLLSQARNLKHLNLASNGFSWQKFPGTELPLGLEYLNLSKTGLVDKIPGDISRLSNLHTLDLSNNRLVGRIPFLSVKNLQVLDLSLNRLTGDIPALVVDKLPYMERFNFSYNNLRLCASKFGPETRRASFFGSSLDNCPIAANSSLFRRPAGPRHRGGLKLALALALSMVFALAGLLFLAFGCRRRRRGTWMWAAAKQNSYKEEQSVSGPFSFQTDSTTWTADVKQANSVPVVIFEKPLLNVTFADLLSATSSFDRGTLLAEGKFGPVYRGFLPGGTHAAVKVLVHGSTLTDREAARELEYLGRIKHPNLVPLTGYCLAGDQRLAIYDYMENGNLQNLLHDLPLGVLSPGEAWDDDNDDENIIRSVGSEGLLTSWKFRHKIALGTARALAFLHHGCFPPIVHRDVKASSVYLDYNLEPRLSDFGLARVFGNGLDEEIARGLPGYLPPELSKPAAVEGGDYSVTPKSDVYCFGVVLFELVTGKKPVGDEYPEEKEGTLVGWVRELVRKSRASRAIDPKIRGTGPQDQMVEALKIGYLCTADLPSKRPTMQQIVGLLKDIIIVDPANASTQ